MPTTTTLAPDPSWAELDPSLFLKLKDYITEHTIFDGVLVSNMLQFAIAHAKAASQTTMESAGAESISAQLIACNAALRQSRVETRGLACLANIRARKAFSVEGDDIAGPLTPAQRERLWASAQAFDNDISRETVDMLVSETASLAFSRGVVAMRKMQTPVSSVLAETPNPSEFGYLAIKIADCMTDERNELNETLSCAVSLTTDAQLGAQTDAAYYSNCAELWGLISHALSLTTDEVLTVKLDAIEAELAGRVLCMEKNQAARGLTVKDL